MRMAPRALLLLALGNLAAPVPLRAAGSWLMDSVREAPAASGQATEGGSPRGASRREARGQLGALALADHDVDVLLLDGFSRTEVRQVWRNPNPVGVEATYRVPLPESATLAEVTIESGGARLAGEVRPEEEAEEIYEDEKSKGNDAGLASKDEYRSFDFRVSRVPAGQEARVRFVYYQPLAVDTGVVRYHYPVEEGGNEAPGASFWAPRVQGRVPLDLDLRVRTTWPVEDLRVPGLATPLAPTRKGPGELEGRAEVPEGQDLVVYYRLAGDLPGRVEVHAFRDGEDGPGTFMAVLTPGLDLPPLATTGLDRLYLLDTSGSMGRMMETLREGVVRSLDELEEADRFRLFRFSDRVQAIGPAAWSPAVPAALQAGKEGVRGLSDQGGTALFPALEEALRHVDPERGTQLVLVTDGVANQGPSDAASFRRLLEETDVRIHAFLLGNQANWPLMRTITRSTGGQYRAVSRADDIGGILALTQQKARSEALHDVRLRWEGGGVRDLSEARRKIYHGEQLVVFGRYDTPGPAALEVALRVSGKPRSYRVELDLPEEATDLPELERLWAMARVEDLQRGIDEGRLPQAATEARIRDLGVAQQIVTDQTSMVLLTDEGFEARGIERRNRARVAREDQARASRRARPVPRRTARVPQASQSWSRPAPSVSQRSSSGSSHRGGGALDPLSALLALGLAGAGLRRREEDA